MKRNQKTTMLRKTGPRRIGGTTKIGTTQVSNLIKRVLGLIVKPQRNHQIGQRRHFFKVEDQYHHPIGQRRHRSMIHQGGRRRHQAGYLSGVKSLITQLVGRKKNQTSVIINRARLRGTSTTKAGATWLNGVINSKIMRRFKDTSCLLYTSPSPRDRQKSRMPSSA